MLYITWLGGYTCSFPIAQEIQKYVFSPCSTTTMQPDQHYQAAIIGDVVNDKLLLEKVAQRIPAKYEKYSLELLKEVNVVNVVYVVHENTVTNMMC